MMSSTTFAVRDLLALRRAPVRGATGTRRSTCAGGGPASGCRRTVMPRNSAMFWNSGPRQRPATRVGRRQREVIGLERDATLSGW